MTLYALTMAESKTVEEPKSKIVPSKIVEYDKYSPWIWIDLESSGLDPMTSEILEISLVVTDGEMNPWDSMHIVIHHPHSLIFAKSSPWCKRHFGSVAYGGNGLFDECNHSMISHQDAEYMLWNFFEFYSSHPVGTSRPGGVPPRRFFDRTQGTNGATIGNYDISNMGYMSKEPHRLVMLAGSTVHFDRGFLLGHFPCLKRFLNHKVIDVTSLLESSRRFRPDVLKTLPRPSGAHRATSDIYDSINLYKFIKDHIFDT